MAARYLRPTDGRPGEIVEIVESWGTVLDECRCATLGRSDSGRWLVRIDSEWEGEESPVVREVTDAWAARFTARFAETPA